MNRNLSRMALGLALISLVPTLTSCSDHGADLGAPEGPPDPLPVSFSQQVQPIFDRECLGCHGAGGNAGLDLRADVSFDNLVGVNAVASAGVLVQTGSPDESVLNARLMGDGLSVMPPAGSLGSTELELVRRWIEEGAADN